MTPEHHQVLKNLKRLAANMRATTSLIEMSARSLELLDYIESL